MSENKEKKCCICSKKFTGFGNNPWGALDENNNMIEWKPEDVCCDECNLQHVVSGRLYAMFNKKGR